LLVLQDVRIIVPYVMRRPAVKAETSVRVVKVKLARTMERSTLKKPVMICPNA